MGMSLNSLYIDIRPSLLGPVYQRCRQKFTFSQVERLQTNSLVNSERASTVGVK